MKLFSIPLRHIGELYGDIRRAARDGWTGAERVRIAFEFLDLALDFMDDGNTPTATLFRQLRTVLSKVPPGVSDSESRRQLGEAVIQFGQNVLDDVLPETVQVADKVA